MATRFIADATFILAASLLIPKEKPLEGLDMNDEQVSQELAVQALAAAVYALHDELVERDLVEPGKVAARLRSIVTQDHRFFATVETVARMFGAQKSETNVETGKPNLKIVPDED